MKHFGKVLKVTVSLFLAVTSVISSLPMSSIDVSAEETSVNSKDYPVVEDAYVRSGGNANKNFNYENITKAHGEQYVGKNYRVVNIKNSGDEIMSVMKFQLPSKEEIESNKFDKFEFQFHIFKNPDYNAGNQSYRFYYTTDTNWNESTITWNNKPESITHEGENNLFAFDIEQGYEYENKTDEEKTIKIDITNVVENLVDQGISEITVFASAKDKMNTSLMIHDRTSGQPEANENGTYASKIIASHEGITLEMLNTLIDECSAIKGDDYTEESFSSFMDTLNAAKEFVAGNPTDENNAREIRDWYKKLEVAKDALVFNGDASDHDNVAYQKATRSNLNKKETSKVTDGNVNTTWKGKFFPSYVDVDLMDTYAISDIQLYFPKDKVIYYTLYGSNDGKNYEELYQSRSDDPKTAEPDKIVFDNVKNYRIIRVYLEYTENESSAYLSEIKVHGKEQSTNTEELRKGTFEEITNIKDFKDTEYAQPITTNETIENVYGIIDRTVGAEYRDWFTFELAENTQNTNDYFELSDKDGKIHIKGNDGVALSTGLNYYYKNYAKVQVSEQTIQGNMPKKIVAINKTIRKETPIKIRYAFNYCTLSYTFAFFGEEEWQRENDWLALNGVNVVLDLAGQEATWIKFLMNYGYSFDDAKDWLVGPGYIAWQYMDNMEVFGGPVPDDYVIDRVELARKTQRWKRSLGMQTVLQGYAGMVPTDFNDYNPDVELISQGDWNGFARPSMIATDSEDYDEMAAKFYEAQKFVYGDTTDYYAVDPFHEGGIRPDGLTDDKISKEVLESMLKYDQDAVWTVQGWQANPTDKLLEGMGENREEHVLIVDLIKYPLVTSGEAQYKKNEFQGTSWAWCLLGNFGGNPTMNGELETMVNEVLDAKASSKHMKGIGIISEATYDNPMIYDLMFDLAWADQDFNLDNWMKNYIERRYGGVSANAIQAWDLIKNANYNEGVRLTKELFGVRTGGVPRNIGKETVGYNVSDLENALRLLLEDYDQFKNSEGYLYDISEIMRQVVSNYALYQYHNVIDARDAKDLEKFRVEKEKFLNAFDVLNEVSKTQKEQLGGEWIGKAQDRAKNYDDFSKSTFEMNAKSLITTWGSVGGALIDYGFRTYEGMFLDVRKTNWTEYLDQVEQNLIDGSPITTPTSGKGYAQKYWKWVIGDQEYTRDAKDSPEEVLDVANRVLEECVFTGEIDPNIGNIALDRVVVVNNDKDYDNNEYITDGKEDTGISVSDYLDNGVEKSPEVVIDLIAEFELSKIQVSTSDSRDFDVYISADGKDWLNVSSSDSDHDGIFKDIKGNGRFVKVSGVNDEERDLVINEVRVYGNRMLPNMEQLKQLVKEANTLDVNTGTVEEVETFKDALKTAEKAIENNAAPDTINTVYWDLYDAMKAFSTNKVTNIALNKKTEAHNDPDGHSERINDGNTSTKWDGGRLSATGKPYEDLITPGWVIIDLDGLYDVSQMNLMFDNSDIWYQYELYTSLDKENWIKVGEKKTENKPNEKEDTYALNNTQARYIKLKATNIKVGSDGKRIPYGVKELQVFGKKISVNKDALKEEINDAEKLDMSNYTESSANVLAVALQEAKDVLKNTEALQQEVDKALENLRNAIKSLKYKDADYSKVDEAIRNANSLDKNLYKDFSKVDEAINKVVRNLDITKQAEVDAMAKAINDAIDALVYKDADYSKVDEIISTIPKDLDKYTEASVKVLNDALNAIVRDLDITHQKEVDKMAENLLNAVKGLQLKNNQPEIPGDKPEVPSDKPVIPGEKPEIPSGKPETPNNGEDNNKDEVKTGVQENNGIYMAGLLAAAVGAGYMVNRKKRKSDVK
jgi:putative alpha-N-acetylglucosaminidase